MEVRKVKAHRIKEEADLADLPHFVGSELADEAAKEASLGRSEVSADDASKGLSLRLARARKLVRWLAERPWPDSSALGKSAGAGEQRGARAARTEGQWGLVGEVVDLQGMRCQVTERREVYGVPVELVG